MHLSYCIYSKYRRKMMFGALRREAGEIFGKVCKMEDVTIIKAATLPDHVHIADGLYILKLFRKSGKKG